ncbi:MAG: hypothetical protein JO210_08485 [Acidobacteriaceae bacterium]|nr:hypothetical protein [Acidobacteriaceae bacterium]
MGANQLSRNGLLLTSLLSTGILGQEARPINLSIITYDAAHIGQKTVHQAEGLGTVLLTANIQSTWEAGEAQDLANLPLDFTAYAAKDCEANTPSLLRLQILPRAPAGLSPNALGFSLLRARSGVQVTIYADHVAKVSETGGPTFGRVLGYRMAHELGHMLLQSGTHAPAGLMKGIWSKPDWQRAAVSVIEFSPAQVQHIAALHERTAAADIAQLASLTPR